MPLIAVQYMPDCHAHSSEAFLLESGSYSTFSKEWWLTQAAGQCFQINSPEMCSFHTIIHQLYFSVLTSSFVSATKAIRAIKALSQTHFRTEDAGKRVPFCSDISR
jgi:hypothetical protein